MIVDVCVLPILALVFCMLMPLCGYVVVKVTVYRPPKDSILLKDVSDSPVEIPANSPSYSCKSLPRKYWKKYLYAARYNLTSV